MAGIVFCPDCKYPKRVDVSCQPGYTLFAWDPEGATFVTEPVVFECRNCSKEFAIAQSPDTSIHTRI